ncbi:MULTISPECIES: 30S ribosomal protein S1 [unclassified Methylophaga]|jgi:small subunit ribosomal protein S1|uniref:30S ribosomal protein S1 n=2 Tax=Gammaproteobacteria TaxID=1236 RepID=A0A2T4CZH1_9GAMM|nr:MULTISPECIES: 30S ribosomal protein S1 [unclassified Methylophaga]MBL1457757.1 30S ribosomal protein S1 [Methylophaga sp.]MDX1750044.1 30S ribosomal protein S1 [Methylophaga sp.]PTB86974.1 30S ribosomal protein S1 [Pseudidiomarina aestuarii]|tara:strand:- start:486 stop:2159 length:1674 start_codon:yes stop_codon:yes gene_type:complete
MSESFADLFEESLNATPMQPGKIVTGTVVNVGPDVVMVNAGLKSEGAIPVAEFMNEKGEITVSVGDLVDVSLETLEDGFGATQLSREKAKAAEAWIRLEHAFEANETVIGIISGKVKGGFTVDLENIRAFLPGSLVDVRPIRDTSHLEGKELEFKLIKLDRPRNNIVVSRRAIMEAENSVEREALLETLEEGKVVKGIVKNLTDYGAFVDLGGIDGLLHITDMAWKRVKHPSEVVAIGDEIDVQVLKFDKERERVSLGLKQLGDDPWKDIARRYPNSTRIQGKVTNIADYGCFVEIEDGVEGLVHMSEMDWTNKNVHPSKLVTLGDEVEVMVLDIDAERRRISLGIKQCQTNPWEEFSMTHNKGDKVSGAIKSITDFGIFIGLDGGIDGLIHLSDISWEEENEELIRDFKKGDEVEAVVLAIDPERERISLGIKQLQDDPFSAYLSEHPRGTVVNGKVIAVDAKGATIELAEGVEGYVRVADIARERIEDASKVLNIGDDVEAKFTGMSRKDRTLTLSIKAKDDQEESEAVKEYSNVSSGNTTLGDLLKEQMNQKDS